MPTTILSSFDDAALSRAHNKAHERWREAVKADSVSAQYDAVRDHASISVELMRRGWRHDVREGVDFEDIPDTATEEFLAEARSAMPADDPTAWASWLTEQDFTDNERSCIGDKAKKLEAEGKSKSQAFAISVQMCAPNKARAAASGHRAAEAVEDVGDAPSDPKKDPPSDGLPEPLGAEDADATQTEPEKDDPKDTDAAEGDGGEGTGKEKAKRPPKTEGAQDSVEDAHAAAAAVQASQIVETVIARYGDVEIVERRRATPGPSGSDGDGTVNGRR